MTSRLLEHLHGLVEREQRGALAQLRRGLKRPPGEACELWPHVIPFVPKQKRDLAPYFLVAALFGEHPPTPEDLRTGRVGERLGKVMRRLDPTHSIPSLERRFVALLGAREQELPFHLTAAVRLAKAGSKDGSGPILIDYGQLLKDVRHWSSPERWTQYAWARDFWRPEPHQAPETSISSEEG